VSVITANETALNWKPSKSERGVQLYLSGVEGDAAELATVRIAGLPVTLNILPTSDWINPDELAGAATAVVQVDADSAASVKRFQKLAASVQTPLIAASYEPPLALVRSLMRSGAHDVIPLPLSFEDVEASLVSLAEQLRRQADPSDSADGKLVSVIKSVGGVGATALLSQLATRFAEREAMRSRDVCLIDLDVQFGDVAFQLGLRPKLSITDLLEAGARLDGDFLRGTTIRHPTGLNVIAAPREIMPLEGLPSDHVLKIVELATREFRTTFLDLPSNWTNWSLSLVARSDVVLMVTELTVAALNRARRQLDLLDSQGLGELDVRLVVNRYDKVLARSISLADASRALGREVEYTVANDFPTVQSAIDRGVSITEIKRNSALTRDLDKLDAGLAAALRLER
jgi:pilus assembly protein CpaE